MADTLEEALAEVGRLIEEAPPHERHERVSTWLDENLPDPQDRQNFLVGVFIMAHERRLSDQAEWMLNKVAQDSS